MTRILINAFIMALFCILAITVRADDVDIYLKTDQIRSAPPYLMFMVDYRPSIFTGGCGKVSDCYDDMSEKAFIQLCIGRAATSSQFDTMKKRKAICTRYAHDLADDGLANYSAF